MGSDEPAEPITRKVIVVDYDPAWPRVFEDLRDRIAPALAGTAKRIEHVGSTSVPGLAAKPIIDMVVVVASSADVPRAIERLAPLGYVHRGDLGIAGREAFARPAHLPAHHLYVCTDGILSLKNQLAVRDHLRRDPAAAEAYAGLKKHLAALHRTDIDGYVAGKTEFILGILRAEGFSDEDLATIAAANGPPAGR